MAQIFAAAELEAATTEDSITESSEEHAYLFGKSHVTHVTDTFPLCPKPETVIMTDLTFVYIDEGRQTLRLGRRACAELRERLPRGASSAVERELFEAADDADEATRRLADAERWRPRIETRSR